MLFILTGDVQIGKSRWLESLVKDLSNAGFGAYGVVAPGIWVESMGPKSNKHGFEKMGIDNILLPSGERLRFADRKDIAVSRRSFDAESQAAKAGLGWHISDDALAKVNDHLSSLPELVKEPPFDRGLLIVDELGRLEIDRGQGLIEGLRLLEIGPQGAIADALIVVRETLANAAEARFAEHWGGSKRISPTEEAALEIKGYLKRP